MRPHAHALKQGRATPPSVRATRRHGGGRTQARNRAHKRLFDTARRMSRQRQKNTTRGHTRRHSATEGRRATRATTKRHRRHPHQPKTAQSGRRNRQTQGERREGDTPTPRARAHTSRTAADMHARGQYACSYTAILYIYYYILFFMPLYISSLSFILQLFSSCCLYSAFRSTFPRVHYARV